MKDQCTSCKDCDHVDIRDVEIKRLRDALATALDLVEKYAVDSHPGGLHHSSCTCRYCLAQKWVREQRTDLYGKEKK